MNKGLIYGVLWYSSAAAASVSFLHCFEFLPLLQPGLTQNKEPSLFSVVLKRVTVLVGLYRSTDHSSCMFTIKIILTFWSRKEKESLELNKKLFKMAHSATSFCLEVG